MTRLCLSAAALALACAWPAAADAAFTSCTYDAGTDTVTATLQPGEGRLYVAAGGAIVSGEPPSGGAQCGAATTANTERIDVLGQIGNTAETAIVDNSGPGGAFRKAGTGDEIDVYVNLGETTWTYEPSEIEAQTLRLIGTTGDDEMRAGGTALTERAVNIDAQSDSDTDVHLDWVSLLDLDGAEGEDYVTGLGGTGTVEPFRGRLNLRGGPGDDRLVGNNYANTLYPGPGHDEVDGGSQIRTCAYLCDHREDDVVSYEDATRAVRINWPHTHGNDDGSGSIDDLTDIEGIVGSGFDDRLSISTGNFLLDGAGGNDEVLGAHQADRLFGGAGDDLLIADADTTGIQTAADQLHGGPGDDSLVGGQDPDVLWGGPGDDQLSAGAIQRTDYEYPKRNTLDGGPGSDVLTGATTDDAYTFRPPVGAEVDTIGEEAHGGRDSIHAEWGEPGFGEPTTHHDFDLSSLERHFGTGGTRTFLVQSAGQAANIEDVSTGFGNDRVTGNAGVNRIETGFGPDVVDVRDSAADSVDCGGSYPVEDPDTVVADHLDELVDCETVDRSAAPAEPPAPGGEQPGPGPGGGDPPPSGPGLSGPAPSDPAPSDPGPATPGSAGLTGFTTKSLRIGRSVFSVDFQRACLSRGSRIALRVKRSTRGRSSLSARLVRASFLVDGKRVAVDSRAPFSTRLPGIAGAGEHTVQVRLLLKPVRHSGGRVKVSRFTTRTLGASLTACG
jgi:Ca2+-binding RTX toxin-like protein